MKVSSERDKAVHVQKMVCDAAGSGCPSEIGEEDVSLRRALEDLLKCMLRVWCKEGQALTKLGAPTPGISIIYLPQSQYRQ